MGAMGVWRFGVCLSAILAVAGSILTPVALAGQTIAIVTAVEGAVTAGPSDDDRRRLEAGSAIFEGDWITSNQTGSAVIEFDGGVRVAMGAATDFDVRSYFPTSGQPNSSLFDVYEGVVQFDLRGAAEHLLGIQTGTAVIDGRAALWTVVAEEWDTVVWVQSGRIAVQGFEPGRDTVGRIQEVRASQFVQIPAYEPAPPPRELPPADGEAIMRRLGQLPD